MITFHEIKLPKVKESKMGLKGSISLIKAIKKNPSTTLISTHKFRKGSEYIEYIVIDIKCDGVPSRNAYGVNYRERIGYKFKRGNTIPDTYALRTDFPILMHQNATSVGDPKNLCLYMESNDVVSVYWTSERHLNRTRWWLELSAKGELHAGSQDLEQFFFVTREAIILPYDYLKPKGRRITLKETISNHTAKKIYKAEWQSPESVPISLNLIEVEISPVTHGIINSLPRNLYELSNLIEKQSESDLLALLKDTIRQSFTAEQINDKPVIIIVKVPIKRTSTSEVEKHQLMGFYSNVPLCNLNTINAFDDDNLDILPVECLPLTSAKDRRDQSGINDDIGNAMIIGAGALGGALIELWSRSGWGEWTVVDDDIFRPHNFTRHVLSSNFSVGESKAIALSVHVSLVSSGSSSIVPISIDATKLEDKTMQSAFKTANIIVDASASLNYPRKASQSKSLPRHVSAFFTPNGKGAVLLAEDKDRKINLSSLEAQYYRALLTHSIGAEHLVDSPDTFRSGVSCRDVSFIMSQSRVMSHASLLSEQIIKCSQHEEADIRIWQENTSTGARLFVNVPTNLTMSNNRKGHSGFEVVWDKGVEEKVFNLRSKQIPKETGGILVGYHDMANKIIFIVDAFPAPSDSVATPISFKRGVDGVKGQLDEIAKRTASNVGYIGEWHSHPDGVEPNMSYLDRIQMKELTEGLSLDGLPACMMIAGKGKVQVFDEVL